MREGCQGIIGGPANEETLKQMQEAGMRVIRELGEIDLVSNPFVAAVPQDAEPNQPSKEEK